MKNYYYIITKTNKKSGKKLYFSAIQAPDFEVSTEYIEEWQDKKTSDVNRYNNHESAMKNAVYLGHVDKDSEIHIEEFLNDNLVNRITVPLTYNKSSDAIIIGTNLEDTVFTAMEVNIQNGEVYPLPDTGDKKKNNETIKNHSAKTPFQPIIVCYDNEINLDEILSANDNQLFGQHKDNIVKFVKANFEKLYVVFIDRKHVPVRCLEDWFETFIDNLGNYDVNMEDLAVELSF